MKRILGGLQREGFEQAKRQYPHTMQKLVLAVKQLSQGRGIPRNIPVADIIGLAKLGVLELEVGDNVANVWLTARAIPMLQQTTLAELQGYKAADKAARKKSNPPLSGVQMKEGEEKDDGEWGEDVHVHPVAAVPGIN
jgi:hypothetical protein